MIPLIYAARGLAIFTLLVIAVGTATGQELRGGGAWKTEGKARRSSQQWDLDLERKDDGSVSGSISVNDSPLMSVGSVQGNMRGNIISGTITDERGDHVAKFEGVLTRGGFRGKYVDRTGESGDWEWEGRLPE